MSEPKPLTPDPADTANPDYNRGWVDGHDRAMDALNPIIDKLQRDLDAERARPDALREAAQAVVDEWDESLRLWLAAGEEEDDDGPAMTAIRDPERETRRRANEAALRAAIAGKEPTDG